MRQKNKGLTLIELLLVISIITVLTAVILVAIDPATRVAEARNGSRHQEVTSILNAVLEYQLDNAGSSPVAIDASASDVQILGNAVGACAGVTCTGQTVVASGCEADLTADLVDEYLASIPTDPGSGTVGDTRYYINQTANGRIVVGACEAELSATIEVQR